MNSHLTEIEFYDLLDKNESPERNDLQTQQHLAGCKPCRAEFDLLRTSLSNFRLTATNLSHVQAPVQLRTRLLDNAPAARFFTVTRAAWATGLIAAMAVCTASLSVLHKPSEPVNPAVQISSETAATAPEVLTDDALLQGIDSDLSTSVPPSLAPLDTNAASEKTTTPSNN